MKGFPHIVCCPGCGRPLSSDDLDLTRTQHRIYDIIVRRPGIDTEQLRGLVWAEDPNGGPENSKTIHVHISKLNKRLARYGVRVRGSISDGYRVRFQTINPPAA
jgi:DNA-binding response OmpR family regulator